VGGDRTSNPGGRRTVSGRKRAFAYRRLNLMRTPAHAVAHADSEEAAVGRGLAAVRAEQTRSDGASSMLRLPAQLDRRCLLPDRARRPRPCHNWLATMSLSASRHGLAQDCTTCRMTAAEGVDVAKAGRHVTRMQRAPKPCGPAITFLPPVASYWPTYLAGIR
jgi:hypothetical protein